MGGEDWTRGSGRLSSRSLAPGGEAGREWRHRRMMGPRTESGDSFDFRRQRHQQQRHAATDDYTKSGSDDGTQGQVRSCAGRGRKEGGGCGVVPNWSVQCCF